MTKDYVERKRDSTLISSLYEMAPLEGRPQTSPDSPEKSSQKYFKHGIDNIEERKPIKQQGVKENLIGWGVIG